MAEEFTRNPDLFDYLAAEDRDLGFHSDRAWTTPDKALAAAFQVLNLADWAQTRQAARRPELYQEKGSNWLIGDHPSTGKVNLLMAAAALGQPLIADRLSGPWRDIFQALTIGGKATTVNNNRQLGLDIMRW